MNKKVKKIIGLLVSSSIIVVVILGLVWLVGTVVSWLCADKGRYILGMTILVYVVYRQMREELDK